MPEDFGSIFKQSDYEFLIDRAVFHLSKLDSMVVAHEDGVLVVQQNPSDKAAVGIDLKNVARTPGLAGPNGEEAEITSVEWRMGLENIVRNLAFADRDTWESIIEEHFGGARDHSSAYNFFFKDFEFAAPRLRFLVKPEGFAADLSDLVYLSHFPRTHSFLVIEHERQMRFIRKPEAAEWDYTTEELFDIAFKNLERDGVTVEYDMAVPTRTPNKKSKIHALLDGDYAASAAARLQTFAPDAVGEFGSVLAIPSKSMVIITPMNNLDSLKEMTQVLPEMARLMYAHSPSSINHELYWYHDDKVDVFHEMPVPTHDPNTGKPFEKKYVGATMLVPPPALISALIQAGIDRGDIDESRLGSLLSPDE